MPSRTVLAKPGFLCVTLTPPLAAGRGFFPGVGYCILVNAGFFFF